MKNNVIRQIATPVSNLVSGKNVIDNWKFFLCDCTIPLKYEIDIPETNSKYS